MNPTLATLECELNAALNSLDITQTQLRPNPTHWSIQQITQHLILTYRSSATAFESRLAKGHPTLTRPTTHQRIAQILVTRLGLMPGRREAPAEVTPADAPPLSGAELSIDVTESLTNLDRLLAQADQAFGPTTRAQSHVFLGPMSATQWRGFHLTHGRHHIRQILAIRANGL